MFAIIYDLSALTDEQRKQYCRDYAEYLGLNPNENRIDTIWMNNDVGRSLVAYCRRGTTDLLRGIHNIDVTSLVKEDGPGYVSYQASGINARGRKEIAVGAYTTTGLTGDRLAAAIATAETRATRRLTLKFVGGGLLDETEVSSQPVQVDSKPVAAPAKQPEVKPNVEVGKPSVVTQVPATTLFDPKMLEALRNSPTNDLPTAAHVQETMNRQALVLGLPKLAPDLPRAPEPLSEPAPAIKAAIPATVEAANAILAVNTPSEPVKPKRGRKKGSKNKIDMSVPSPDGVETTQLLPNADIKESQQAATPIPPTEPPTEPPTGQLLTYVPFCPDCPPGTHMAADDRLDIYLCVKHGKIDTTMKPSVVQNVKPEPVVAPIPVTPSPAPPVTQSLLTPEQQKSVKTRLSTFWVYILPEQGGMTSDDGLSINAKLMKFADAFKPDHKNWDYETWDAFIKSIEQYNVTAGPVALVEHINKTIGAN